MYLISSYLLAHVTQVYHASVHCFCCSTLSQPQYKVSGCLWLVQMAEQGQHPVVAVKTARVGDFNGKTLGTISTSLVDVDPDVPEAGTLRNW